MFPKLLVEIKTIGVFGQKVCKQCPFLDHRKSGLFLPTSKNGKFRSLDLREVSSLVGKAFILSVCK